MKYLMLLITLLLITSCTQEPKQTEINKTGAFYINKSNDTFEIYSNKGELILEYTSQNTDSASLGTLDEIYETVKEFYNVEYEKETIKKLEDKKI